MAETIRDLAAQVDPHCHVLIAGPTASGKSALALALAEAQGGTIVNADALQVYANWRILSARPNDADLARVPHLLYGHVAPDQTYSAGHWLREVDAVLQSGQRLVIVGGTGLNFMALTEGLAVIPAVSAEIRAEADARMATLGLEAMVRDLDAETCGRIDLRNPARVRRAWEVLRATGRGLADWQRDTRPPLLPLSGATALCLQTDRDTLAARIDARFDAMMAAGALDEARAALPGWNPALPSAKAIGAPELIAHLRGDLSLAEAVDQAKTASRQYAKRQRTWFRARMADWRPILLSG